MYYTMLSCTILFCTILHYSIYLQGGRIWSDCHPRGSHRCRVHDTRGKVATRPRTKRERTVEWYRDHHYLLSYYLNSGIACPLSDWGGSHSDCTCYWKRLRKKGHHYDCGQSWYRDFQRRSSAQVVERVRACNRRNKGRNYSTTPRLSPSSFLAIWTLTSGTSPGY